MIELWELFTLDEIKIMVKALQEQEKKTDDPLEAVAIRKLLEYPRLVELG